MTPVMRDYILGVSPNLNINALKRMKALSAFIGNKLMAQTAVVESLSIQLPKSTVNVGVRLRHYDVIVSGAISFN